MSDVPDVFTHRNLPRNELDKFFHNNPRIRKAFEDLLLDVGVTLPDAIGAQAENSQVVLALRTFTPPPPPPPPPNNDAAGILAAQIFGA